MQNFTKKGAAVPLGSPLNPPLKIAKGKYVCHLPCGFCLLAYHVVPRKRIEQEKNRKRSRVKMKLSHTYKREPGSGVWRPLFCFKRPLLLTIWELVQWSVEAGAPHRVKSAKLWQKSLTINPSLVCNRFGSSCKVAKPLQWHLNSFSPMDQHDKVGNSNIQTTLSPK